MAADASGATVESVPKSGKRRTFTAAEKLRIVRTAATCTEYIRGLALRTSFAAGARHEKLRAASPMSALTASVRSFLDLPDEVRALGPYRCRVLVGRGGFAPVFRATEEHGGLVLREVAVKVFGVGARDARGGPETRGFRARVIDEARALCRVQHPNVVRFFTLFEDLPRGLVALVMEYADGVSLDAQLAELARDDPRRMLLAVEVGLAVASALAVAHQAGIVHRDVKPANVLFCQGVYKLIDFGIAAMERPKGIRIEPRRVVLDGIPLDVVGTRASFLARLADTPGSVEPISGTVGYIDPVCLRATEPATAGSDLYGLGAMLYECLAGVVPAVSAARARGETGLDPAVMLGDAKPLGIGEVVASVPPPLAKLIDALLSPAPRDRPRTAEHVARELERMRGTSARERKLPPEEVGPFRGLDRFQVGDRDVYFGRSVDVAAAIELLRSRGLVSLVGASGSGKSSLARAGIVPTVRDGALGPWPPAWDAVVVSPGRDPYADLCLRILDELDDHSPAAVYEALVDHVEATQRGIILIIDQAEELATVAEPRSCARFLEVMTRIGERPLPGLRAVVAVRRDLLDAVLALDPLHFSPLCARGMLFVQPLTDSVWGDVIDEALGAYGYSFEDDALRTQLLADLHRVISAMPLVQFALTELWMQRDRESKKLTRAAYDSMGGLRGALEQHAEATAMRIFAEVSSGFTLRDLLLELTTELGTRVTRTFEQLAGALIDGDSVAGTLNDDLRSYLESRLRKVLRYLEEARLVMREVQGFVIAHEALLSQWARLHDWLAEFAADRRRASELGAAAQAWSEHGRDPELLLTGRRLLAAEELLLRATVRVSDIARAFVSKSQSGRQKRGFLLGGASVAVLVLLGLGTTTLVQHYRTEELRARIALEGQRARSIAVGALAAQTALAKSLSDSRSDWEDALTLIKIAEASDPSNASLSGTKDLLQAKMSAKPKSAALVTRPEEPLGGVGLMSWRNDYSGSRRCKRIESIYRGYPAARAGLVKGDCIVTVDGRSAPEMSESQFADGVRGARGTIVELGVLREGPAGWLEVRSYFLTREIIDPSTATLEP